MKRFFKYISIYLICSMFLFMISACSSSTKTTEDASKGTQPAQNTANAKVLIWTNKAELSSWFKDGTKDLNTQIVEIPASDYNNKIRLAFAGNDSPDICMMDQPFIASFALTDALAPLDSYWKAEDINKYPKNAIEACRYNGKLFAIPIQESGRVLAYNKKLLSAAGIVPPTSIDKAWSFEQITEIAKKLTVKDGNNVSVYGFSPAGNSVPSVPSDMYPYLIYIYSAGGGITDSKVSTATGYFDNEGTKKAMKFLQDLYVGKYSPMQAVPDGFGNGKIAITLCSQFDVVSYSKFPDLEFGIAPLPKDKQPTTCNGSWWLSMSNQSKVKDAAWKVLEVVTTIDSLGKLNTMNYSVPNKEGVKAPELEKLTYFQIMNEYHLKGYSKPRPVTPKYSVVNNEVLAAIGEICYGQDINTALKKYTDNINKILAK